MYFIESAIKEKIKNVIYTEFKDEVDSGQLVLTDEKISQHYEAPSIDIRIRRVNQSKSSFRGYIDRLYMFSITYLHSERIDTNLVNFNEVADELANRLMLALNNVSIDGYDKLNNIVNIKLGSDEINTVKEDNFLTVLADYTITFKVLDSIDNEKFERCETFINE